MKERANIYVYCQPIDNIYCGSVYCAGMIARWLPGSIPNWDLTKLTDIAKANSFIDSIEDDLIVLSSPMHADEINFIGWGNRSQSKLDLIISQLIYEQKLTNYQVIKTIPELPALKAYPDATVDSQHIASKLLALICKLKRLWLIEKHFHKLYPQYNLMDNLGYLNYKSLKLILEKGVAPGFTINRSLAAIPRLYLQGVLYLSDEFLLYPPVSREPLPWWKEYFGDVLPFSLEESLEYDRLVNAVYPRSFTHWLPVPSRESREEVLKKKNSDKYEVRIPRTLARTKFYRPDNYYKSDPNRPESAGSYPERYGY